VEDVRKTGSRPAMVLLEMDALKKRLNELSCNEKNSIDQDDALEKRMRKPRGAKRPAIDFIKTMILNSPAFSVLISMRSGKNFKTQKHLLWLEFVGRYPEHKDREHVFKNDYVTDALNELRDEKKQVLKQTSGGN
jgi:hypothetical protein